MGFKFGQRSITNLNNVHPFLIKIAEKAIQISPLDFTIVEGVRTLEKQKKNVELGFSKTMKSKHLIQQDGYGHAFDVYPYYNGSVQVNAPIEKFKLIADTMQTIANELKINITRGYDWGWDAPHYELKNTNINSNINIEEVNNKSEFNIAYNLVKDYEGGYCNIAGDAGGETYAGITRTYFSDWKGWKIIDDSKKDISFKQSPIKFSNFLSQNVILHDLVLSWYRHEWWDKMNISQFEQNVANELFEQSINLGRSGSGKLIQLQINALNWFKNGSIHGGKIFNDLKIDGILGPDSLKAITILLKDKITSIEFIKGLNNLQYYHYTQLASTSFVHRKFLSGWYTRT